MNSMTAQEFTFKVDELETTDAFTNPWVVVGSAAATVGIGLLFCD